MDKALAKKLRNIPRISIALKPIILSTDTLGISTLPEAVVLEPKSMVWYIHGSIPLSVEKMHRRDRNQEWLNTKLAKNDNNNALALHVTQTSYKYFGTKQMWSGKDTRLKNQSWNSLATQPLTPCRNDKQPWYWLVWLAGQPLHKKELARQTRYW